jgi:hypothetical protein
MFSNSIRDGKILHRVTQRSTEFHREQSKVCYSQNDWTETFQTHQTFPFNMLKV